MTHGEKDSQHLSPASIRSEVFGHRMRGLDEDEVREYLEVLADQVEDMQAELARRRAEVEHLRTENRSLRDESERASATPQTVAPGTGQNHTGRRSRLRDEAPGVGDAVLLSSAAKRRP